ncbi:MAG: DUF1501 domain-containing protein, partial [Planctomycetes bacterium]|nr:DUF1501 domain-containing protein [Planctomycetota bacterium]
MSHYLRRHFLSQSAFGISGLALSSLLTSEGWGATPAKPELGPRTYDLKPKSPSGSPKATAMISMFMQGGPSQVDLFDPKPELTKRHMQTYTGNIKYDNAAEASSKLFGSPWTFSKHGKSGIELSELLPGLGTVIDDVCVIRSMHSGVDNHVQA